MMKDNEIKKIYERVDNGINSGCFTVAWEQARSTVDQKQVYIAQPGEKTGVMKIMMGGAAMAAVIMVIASILIIDPQNQKTAVTGNENETMVLQESPLIAPIDPNQPWYAPTDDLLQVNVLSYQNQWITFTQYDPITMEIR